MIKYTKKTITQQVTQVDYIQCDLCGKQKKHQSVWDDGLYDIQETTIEIRTGKQYPDSYYADVTKADICPQCFVQKIIPTLKKIGVKFYNRVEEH